MAQKPVTIYDVANEAGVSMATVSRVVNGNPNVKKETREKVEEVIERLNYQPNAVARGLASSKSTTVGVILPDITNLFYGTLALGIDDIAAMYKYNIFMASIDKELKQKRNVIDDMLAKQVDGLIYMGYTLPYGIRKKLEGSNKPVVLAGTVDPQKEIPSVNIDYHEATRQCVEYFIEQGHENIAIVFDQRNNPINEELRYGGYVEAFENHGLKYQEEWIIRLDDPFNIDEEIYEDMVNENITALISCDDEFAISLSNGLQDHGVKIPEEFEIITSNNTKISRLAHPELSTIVQPLYDIGAVSMRLLTKLMSNEEVDEKNTILPHTFESRGTTRK